MAFLRSTGAFVDGDESKLWPHFICREVATTSKRHQFLSARVGLEGVQKTPCDSLASVAFSYAELCDTESFTIARIHDVAAKPTIPILNPENTCSIEIVFDGSVRKEPKRAAIALHQSVDSVEICRRQFRDCRSFIHGKSARVWGVLTPAPQASPNNSPKFPVR